MITTAEFIEALTAVRPKIMGWATGMLANRDDAEDVAQEVLIKLWALRERLVHDDEVSRLSYTITRNICIDRSQASSHHAMIDIETAHGLSSAPADMQMIADETQRRMERAIAAMPPKYRAILDMRNTQGLSYLEIGQIIGATEASVRGMISKARAMIMKQMTKN